MARNPNRSRLLTSACGALLAVGLGLLLHFFPFGRGLAQLSYDLLLVARGDQAVDEVVVVYLDEASHLKLNQSFLEAWDRNLHARLIRRLHRAGARAIAFDIVFSDPNPADPDSDIALAEAIQTDGPVVLAADRIPLPGGGSQTIPPFDLLLDATAGLGSAEVIPDRDLVIRHHTPESELPSLAWATAEVIGASVVDSEANRKASRWINYYGPPNWLPSESYADALDPEVIPDDVFRDKVVFVGARIMTKYAGERKDEYRNPFSNWISHSLAEERGGLFISGVEVQATMFLNLLRGDWLSRLSSWKESALLSLTGLVLGWTLVRLRPGRAGLAALGCAVGVMVGSYVVFRWGLIWLPWLFVLAQLVVALGWSVLVNSIQLYVQKRLYENTLALYLSPKLVRKFSGDPSLLKPGAQKQMLSLFFSDIEDFTRLSEGMDSDELASLMNQYFQSAVSDCVHRTDGTVVKYIGDAIFAFWSAPEPQPDHALRACEAALRFRDLASRPINGIVLRTRIGLHSGIANVGNFGSTERVDYTALGESVNLASRVEGLNKFLRTDCLITEDTNNAMGDELVTRRLGRFRLKGFDKAVGVYELVGWPDDRSPTQEWRNAFEGALQAYERRDFENAANGFRRTIQLRIADGPASFYLHHINRIQATSLPRAWRGEVELSEK